MASKNHNGTRDPAMIKSVVSVIPKKRQDLIKWNGWGYNDSAFITVNDEVIKFTGDRYPIGNMYLPNFTEWVKKKFDIDIKQYDEAKPPPEKYPECILVEAFMIALKEKKINYSLEGIDRLIRSHGQTLYDIHSLLVGKMNRIPDVVVWPASHEDVIELVQLATQFNVVVIPYGGGTSVSGAITCPEGEVRCIVALDTSQMNRLLWLDKANLVACFEAGIVGQDLERELRAVGLTLGHEPDSFEFSTLGGWVATRASGMKKNVYGNIEDLVVRVKMVTPKGVLERHMSAPRASCGPDFNHIVLGSEGTLGVVTEVLLKVRPVPPVKKYGSLVFPDFANGVKFMREIARRRCQPASIRLMDNEQFQFGQALKPTGSLVGRFVDGLKKTVLTKIKGIDLTQMCVATLVYEGEEVDVVHQEKLVNEIASRHSGIPAGAENGERGYVLTFVIAYIRDLALRYRIVAESFETSVPWDRCEALCENVKERVRRECAALNIPHYLISCRVTQTYDAGACIYFYFGFKYTNHADPVHIYEEIESRARDECLANGGSISHHHGVGKLRSRWYPQSVSNVGVDLYKATKKELDPSNIFAIGNLLEGETMATTTDPMKAKL